MGSTHADRKETQKQRVRQWPCTMLKVLSGDGGISSQSPLSECFYFTNCVFRWWQVGGWEYVHIANQM